jgi:hypothetical protein
MRARHVSLCLAFFFAGCAREVIPNTQVEDTEENRSVLDFMEKYRNAVEQRDAVTLGKLASEQYFDDMGTPAGDDDMDREALLANLKRMREEILAARYQISYRNVTYVQDRVLVDIVYTGWFKVQTTAGNQWRRRLEPHRLVLQREDDSFLILSGM